jgi:acyl-CoA thioesterase-1
MNGVIYFFGGGEAFFAGVGLVLVSAAVQTLYHRKWVTSASTLVAFLGLILIALSATPLPYWFYGAAGTISLLWLLAERLEGKPAKRYRGCLRLAVVLIWSTAAVMEIPYQLAPTLKPAGRPTLYIFADSVTAGMGETSVDTWPQLLARSHSIDVQDHSQIGAKVSSMLRKAERVSLGDGIVLLEIGGNDLLGSTHASEFERQLDQLLLQVCGPGRIVLMFELPLPPFANEFGRIQRRLASKYQVKLIPKRIFVRLLTTDGATVDSIHLTQDGHERMAQTVWSLIQSAYEHSKAGEVGKHQQHGSKASFNFRSALG